MSIEKLKEWIYDVLISKLGSSFDRGDGTFNIFYYENTSAEPEYPYLVYQFIGGTSDRDSGTRYHEPIVQFSIFSNSASSSGASQLGDLLDEVFDDHPKGETANDIILGIERIVFPRETRTELGNWSWSADYKISLQTKGA